MRVLHLRGQMTAREDHCSCTGCGLLFASTDAFDAHRVGDHAYLASAERPDGRRCLTEDELAEAGLRLSAAGRWMVRQPSIAG